MATPILAFPDKTTEPAEIADAGSPPTAGSRQPITLTYCENTVMSHDIDTAANKLYWADVVMTEVQTQLDKPRSCADFALIQTLLKVAQHSVMTARVAVTNIGLEASSTRAAQ